MTTTWRRDPAVLWRRSGASVVVLCRSARGPFVLHGTGQLVWELLEEPLPYAELVRLLARLCRADPSVVVRDLEPFLAELFSVGALTTVDDHEPVVMEDVR